MKHSTLLRKIAVIVSLLISSIGFAQVSPLNIGIIPPGKSVSVVYDVIVNSGTSVTNQASIAGANFGTFLSNDPKTATPNDATVTSVQAVTPGAALDFGGTDDHVIIPHNTALNLTTLTVECWINTTTSLSPAGIVNKWASGNGWLLYQSGSNLTAGVSTPGGASCFVNSTGQTINNGVWHHVAFVADASGCKIYIDGILCGSNTWTGTPGTITNTNATDIGFYTGVIGSEYFVGKIDEVRIWNRALCLSEITNNMNCEIATTGTGLLANYHFNQGIAGGNNVGVTTLTDASGNNFNGTLTNFALTGTTSNWVAPGAVTSGVSCAPFLTPEINLKGNTVSIVDGDATPDAADETDFGNANTAGGAGGSLTRTFTIENITGTATLTVSSITVTGTNAAEFVVTGAPSSVTAGNSATFDVTFTPGAIGPRTATVHVNNNDCDEADYDFAVQGMGNSAPVVTTSAGTTAYTQGTPVAVDPTLTVFDANNGNLFSADVSLIAGSTSSEDVLQFTNQNGITGSFNINPAGDGVNVLTLTGSSSVSNYETALRSVKYNNTSATPNTANRTIRFIVFDGTSFSNAADKTVTIAAPPPTDLYVDDNSNVGDVYTPLSAPGNDATGNGTAAAPYRTITKALSVAVAGNTIYVDAGTFTEQVEITKSITINGAGAALTTIASPAGTLALSYTIPPSGTIHRPIVFVHDAAGVIIKNLTVDGLGNGSANNRFQGIAYRNAGGTLDNTVIKAIRNNPLDGVQAGVAIYASATDGTARTLNVTNSTLTDFQKNGTVFSGANLTVNFDNNTVTGAGSITDIAQNGVQVSGGAAGTITNNIISGFNYTPSSVTAVGVLIFGPGTVATSGNTITNAQSGIYYIGSGGNITNNIMNYSAAAMSPTPSWFAITVNSGTYTVSGNEIDGDGNGVGIEADSYAGETTTMTATNNKVVDTDEGVIIYEEDGTAIANTEIHENSITGSSVTYAIDNAGATNANATCNWYGTTDPAVIAAKISGPVTYIPYLTNGTDDQPATRGFQPVPNSCVGPLTNLYVDDNSNTDDVFTPGVTGSDVTGNGTVTAPFRTISKALSVANAGNTIHVDAGTYTENVVVNKEVTILGAGAALTIVQPAISIPNNCSGSLCAASSNVFLVQASNVSIQSLTVDGDNPALTSGIVIAGADIDARNGIITDFNSGDYTNLTVHHTTVKNIFYRGIYSAYGSTPGQTFNFHHNTVSNVKGDASSIGIFNFGNSGTVDNNNVSDASDGIAANQSTGTVFSNNTVTTSGSGIHTDNNGGSGGAADIIKNNTITNSTAGGYGILVFLPSFAVTVQENTVTNVDYALMNAGQQEAVTTLFQRNTVDGMNKPGSRGVYQTTSTFGLAGSTNVSGNYINNYITNNDDGFYLEYEVGQTNTITANNNSITGNTPGVTFAAGAGNAGTLVNNFECNWWGTSDPALIAAAVGAPVDYTPYLNNGGDNPAIVGFQPTGSCGITGDSDGDGVLDVDDCAPFDPNNTTHKPKLNTSINGVPVNSNNDGVDDQAAFSVANTATNIVFNSFTDANDMTGPLVKAYQVIETTNVTVPFCNNCSASLSAFAGASGTAALIDPNTSGTLVMKFREFVDANGNGQIDVGECSGDQVVYTVTVNPNANPCANDVTPPVITLKSSPKVFLTASNTYTVQLIDVLQSVSDNCDPNPGATLSTLEVTCANIGFGGGSSSAPHQAYTSTASAGNSTYGGEVGLEFSVADPNGIIINKLGAFDDQGDGISGTQGGGVRVAIFDKSSTSNPVNGLDVTIVGSADPLSGNYRFKTISPITLLPGNYVLVAKGYNGAERFYNGNQGAPVDGAGGSITFSNTARWGNPAAPFSYPSNSGPAGNPTQYTAASFIYNIMAGSTSNMVTVTATDASGNQSQATTSVEVIDTIYTLAAKNITVNLDGSGSAVIQPSDVLASLKNNCGLDVTGSSLQVSPSSFNCSNVGGSSPSHQAYTSTASAGNSSYGGEVGLEFSVAGPNGIVISKLGAFDDQGNGILGTQGGGVRVAIFNKSSTANPVSGLDVTIVGTADPLSGNYRFKTIAPVTLLAGNYVLVAKGYNAGEMFFNGNQGAPVDGAGGTVTFSNTARWGNPSGPLSYPSNSGDAGNPTQYTAASFIYNTNTGSGTTVTLTATDGYGNQKQATAIVVVKDNTGPAIITKNITVNLDATGHASIQPNDVLQSPVTDNCGVNNASISVSPNSFSCTDFSSGSPVPHQAYTSNTSTVNSDYGGEVGLEFSVTNPNGIIINKLGAFDDQGNGISGTQGGGVRVAIFDKSSTANPVNGLNVTIVGTTDPLSGNYRFQTIAPVTLLPGNYVLVAKGYNAAEMFFNGNQGAPVDGASGSITFSNTARWGDAGSGFGYPGNSGDAGNPTQYTAASFIYSINSGSNNKVVTVSATDIHGNVSTATAIVTLEDPTGACGSAAPTVVTGDQKAVTATDEKASGLLTNALPLKIYPNPSNGQFTVQLFNLKVPKVTLQVIDQSGKMVEQKSIGLTGKTASLSIPVNIRNHAAGVYWIKVISEDGVKMSRVVVGR